MNPLRVFSSLRYALVLTLALLGACDQYADRNLVVGQHSEADVRQLMGVPTMIWDLPGGARQFDYIRAPGGFETWRVDIAPDGRYQGMKQLLTDENFKRLAQVGMTGEELTRLFSRPAETQRYALSNEVIWLWRYEGLGGIKYNFNAHFDATTMRVKRYSVTDDRLQTPGA
jgi:hypothetical protein